MKQKKLYNYKRALTVPFMVQKLWRGFTLENPLELTKVAVFGLSLISLFTIFRPVVWLLGFIPGLNLAAYILIPIGVVMLYDRLEPDGLKIHEYVIDYLFFLLSYKGSGKVICQSQTFKQKNELVVFEKIQG
ncbi:TcpE family conjugal transfer membrane protein [Enterococcus sp. BWR-S5]|uniref:TcpE family conjugal transfer membrane protein n=1 Tax=Enterococcus sp. BWR-S5 TaxID=2787714 RepID=UPI001922C82C|nr:TcpE family conjugal transfer membrane protein [Enterococcus sp. BWR-S5]MBL1226503.1 conjugal transfer protein [Enterococcus sp. BWR-S5]